VSIGFSKGTSTATVSLLFASTTHFSPNRGTGHLISETMTISTLASGMNYLYLSATGAVIYNGHVHLTGNLLRVTEEKLNVLIDSFLCYLDTVREISLQLIHTALHHWEDSGGGSNGLAKEGAER